MTSPSRNFSLPTRSSGTARRERGRWSSEPFRFPFMKRLHYSRCISSRCTMPHALRISGRVVPRLRVPSFVPISPCPPSSLDPAHPPLFEGTLSQPNNNLRKTQLVTSEAFFHAVALPLHAPPSLALLSSNSSPSPRCRRSRTPPFSPLPPLALHPSMGTGRSSLEGRLRVRLHQEEEEEGTVRAQRCRACTEGRHRHCWISREFEMAFPLTRR